MSLLDLHPDRALLDPNFDGYKLCLDEVPMLTASLFSSVLTAMPAPDQFAYINSKFFYIYNHLTGDPFVTTPSVYFINKDLEVQKVYIDVLCNEINVVKVWDVPSSLGRKEGDFNVSLRFASKHLAVLSDGSGLFYLLNTGSRMNDNPWQCIFKDEVIGPSKRFIIQDVIHLNSFIHCLLSSVDHDVSYKKYISVLSWITLSKADDNAWGCVALRELKCNGDIVYAYLEPSCSAVYCISDVACKFTIDSENPIQLIPEVNTKYFQWMQTSDSIKLKFNLPEVYVHDNICVDINEGEINISYENETFLKGALVYEVDVELSTWNVRLDVLEICLRKKTVGTTWPEVVIEDNNGKYISTLYFESDDDDIEHPTSETEVTAVRSEFGPIFNNQQLEECDFEDVDTLITFQRLCVKSHKITYRAKFGTASILLTTKRKEDLAPAVVVRNDVDGCLWQPLPADSNFNLKHEATLFAFGFILASKQQKKFAACAPDLGYSVICESSRHVFIYQQNKPINNAELRNRTSGKRFGTVAQQRVICIPDGEIYGIHAMNSTLFLLTANKVVVFKL